MEARRVRNAAKSSRKNLGIDAWLHLWRSLMTLEELLLYNCGGEIFITGGARED